MKRPAFQFYPGDWRKDPALSICSLAARGLWIELMCIAHESDDYGHLSVNGKGMTTAQLARMVGETPALLTKLLAELEDANVFSRTSGGVIFSRRMLKDEHIRNVRAAAGARGGNPNLMLRQPSKTNADGSNLVKQKPEQNLTPSSSSSSSSSNTHTAGSQTQVCVDEIKDTQDMDIRLAMSVNGLPSEPIPPSTPALRELIRRGVPLEQFVGAARIAATHGKGFAYAIGVVKQQLKEAEGITSPETVHAGPWHATREGIEAKGVELGIGRWDRTAFDQGKGERFDAYTKRIRERVAAQSSEATA